MYLLYGNSIQNLIFGDDFNQMVDNLPNSIQSLTFGKSFNQMVDNLPNSIQSLTFSWTFDKLFNNLPIELEIVKIKKFNSNIETITESILQINPSIKIIEF